MSAFIGNPVDRLIRGGTALKVNADGSVSLALVTGVSFTSSGVQPAASSPGISSGNFWSHTAPKGGDTNAAGVAAGTGGAFAFTTGGGGASITAGAGTNTGADGGAFTVTTGAGGAASGGATSNVPGKGGNFVINTGAAGSGGDQRGGDVSITFGSGSGITRNGQMNLTNNINPSLNSSAVFSNIGSNANISGSSNVNVVIGIGSQITNTNTGTVSDTRAYSGSVTNNATSGTVSVLRGFLLTVTNANSGNATEATVFHGMILNTGSGSIGPGQGAFIFNAEAITNSGSGTVSMANSYYTNVQTVGTANVHFQVGNSYPASGNYTLYDNSGYQSWHSGNLGIGTGTGTKTPVALITAIDVAGPSGASGTAGDPLLLLTGAGGGNATAVGGTAGNAGAATITLGNGGAATAVGSSGTNTGGNGGSLTITAGNGGNASGNSTNLAGGGGNIILNTGASGTGGNRQGGDITINFGMGTGTGRNGRLIVNGDTQFASGTVMIGGAFQFLAAVSQLLPGATSFSIRNNANSADNILIGDSGIITVRNTLVMTAGAIQMGQAVSQLLPGVTSFAIRNNANTFDNLLVNDNGDLFPRGAVTISNPVHVRSSSGFVLGQYATLSAALAAITTASPTNRFQIWITGNIIETVEIVLKSNIDIHFTGGSSVTNANDDNTVTMRCNNVTNATVYDATWIRSGTVTNTNAPICGVISGTTDDSVRFYNTRWLNRVTKGIGTTNGQGCHGIYQTGTSAPHMVGCEAIGASADMSSHGFMADGTSVGFHKDCYFKGGAGGNAGAGNSYGGYFLQDHAGNYVDCEIIGGDGGTGCHGVQVSDRAEPEFIGGMAKGGQNGTNGSTSHGVNTDFASNSKYFRVKIEGGDAGAQCIGLNANGSSTVQCDDCTLAGGRHGVGCQAVNERDAASIFLRNCATAFRRTPGIGPWTYNSAGMGGGTGSFQATQGNSPFSVMTVRINVINARAGAFIHIGSTAGASDVVLGSATNLSMGTTGYQYATIQATQPIIAGSGYLFATPAGAGGVVNGDFTVEVSGVVDYASCEAVFIRGTGYVEIGSSDLYSGRASDCFHIDAAAVTANALLVTNTRIHAWQASTSPKKAVNALSAYASAPFYHCTMIGGVTNITAAAGTANGTNTVV